MLLGKLLHVRNEVINFIYTIIDVMMLCSIHVEQVYTSLKYLVFFHAKFYVQKGNSVGVQAIQQL
jgi:hypothetical protein